MALASVLNLKKDFYTKGGGMKCSTRSWGWAGARLETGGVSIKKN